MKNPKTTILVFFLLGVTAFSVYKFVSAVKEKDSLKAETVRLQAETKALKDINQSLSQQLDKGKVLEQQLQELSAQFSLLKEENVALQQEKASLKAEVEKLTRQNEDFTVRFNSIGDLKKAIRELKIKMRKVKAEIRKNKAALINNIEGNKGFIVKDGKVAQPAWIRIEVKPASTTNE